MGGTFILRIEDTDRQRSRADSEQAIFDALRWLGLEWKEGPDIGGPYGPYRQSERSAIYREHAELLINAGQAYRCFCAPERLEEVRKARMAQGQNPGYDRHCRDLPAAESRRRAADESFTVRLAVPLQGSVRFRDRLRGDVEISVEQVDDQVLLKSDGFPTYHLANVVDDHLMQISHVIRAEEWISSTPKHVLLYQAFGWEAPEWIHMPLLRNADRSKISKRKNPVSINYYRDAGILPRALVNFLAILGWSFGDDREKFTVDEMVERFSWERVSLGGPVFDPEKLRWLNEKYLQELDYEQLVDELLAWRLRREHLLRIAPLVRERIKRLDEFIPVSDFFFSGDLDYAPVAAELRIPDVAPRALQKALHELVEQYEALSAFAAPGLEAASRAFCEARGWKTKHAFMLLRLAITGRKASPPLFETMEVLGKELSRRRLRQAADLIGTFK
jgi:glutamyl-tRNA synthetase